MKNLLTFAALATITLASCNNDNDNVTPVPAGDNLIRFGAQAMTVDTKAPFEGTISGSNTLTAYAIGSQTSNSYGMPYTDTDGAQAKGDITFIDNGTTQSGFSTGVIWPASTATIIYFRGFYPAGGVWTASGTNATAVVDGKTDLMNTTEISGSKQSVLSTPLLFKFSHLLTKLHVKVQGNDKTAKDWGKITKIELSKAVNVTPANQLAYTYAGDVVAFSGSAAIPFYAATDGASVSYSDEAFTGMSYDIPTTSALAAYALVAPVTGVAGSGNEKSEYTLNITTTTGKAAGGKEVAINLQGVDGKDFIGSTAGKKFDITIQFLSEGQITATATVKEWMDGGSGNGQM